MSNSFPHELSVGDVYFSPFLPAIFIAFIATLVTTVILNKLKLSRFFFAPEYVFVSLMVLYLVLIDTYWITF